MCTYKQQDKCQERQEPQAFLVKYISVSMKFRQGKQAAREYLKMTSIVRPSGDLSRVSGKTSGVNAVWSILFQIGKFNKIVQIHVAHGILNPER